MKKFKNYILERKLPETKRLSEDEFFNLLPKCDNIEEGVYLKIFRTVDLKDDFYFINNENYERRSAYTSNQYTLWINNHEEWKDYPKRNLICSLNYKRYFGECDFVVIPFKNSKWGIVPSYDIQDIDNIYRLNDLPIRDDNFDNMMKDLEDYNYKIKSPEELGFTLRYYKDVKHIQNNLEIWTDSNVLLIRDDIFEKIFKYYEVS